MTEAVPGGTGLLPAMSYQNRERGSEFRVLCSNPLSPETDT
jgi:hypothetical protein